jgi:hypothetical protein
LAITTPSSACGTTPWREPRRHDALKRVEQFAKGTGIEQGLRPLPRAEFDEAVLVQAASVMADLLETLLQAQTHHAGVAPKSWISMSIAGGVCRRTSAQTGAASVARAIDRGLHGGSSACRPAGSISTSRSPEPTQPTSATAGRLPGGEFKG